MVAFCEEFYLGISIKIWNVQNEILGKVFFA
jgi:hypothetical protein